MGYNKRVNRAIETRQARQTGNVCVAVSTVMGQVTPRATYVYDWLPESILVPANTVCRARMNYSLAVWPITPKSRTIIDLGVCSYLQASGVLGYVRNSNYRIGYYVDDITGNCNRIMRLGLSDAWFVVGLLVGSVRLYAMPATCSQQRVYRVIA